MPVPGRRQHPSHLADSRGIGRTTGSGKGPTVVLVLAPAPESIPGADGTAVRSQVDMTRSRRIEDKADFGSASWSAVTEDGAKMDVELRYFRSTPTRQVTVRTVYSGDCAGIFDGREQLVSVSAIPWHAREVSVP